MTTNINDPDVYWNIYNGNMLRYNNPIYDVRMFSILQKARWTIDAAMKLRSTLLVHSYT